MANGTAAVWPQTVWLQPGLSPVRRIWPLAFPYFNPYSTIFLLKVNTVLVNSPFQDLLIFINCLWSQFRIWTRSKHAQTLARLLTSCAILSELLKLSKCVLTHLKMLSHWVVERIKEQTKYLVQSPPGSQDCEWAPTSLVVQITFNFASPTWKLYFSKLSPHSSPSL